MSADKMAVLADFAEELGLVDGATRLWVVEGTEGNYSDRREWPVAIYFDEATALAHVAAARAEEDRLRAVWMGLSDDNASFESYEWRSFAWSREESARWVNVFDPSLSPGDTSVEWLAYSVPLRRALPEVKP